MKNILMICNAHIDPIWQWEWEEGASAALSTFKSAINLLKEHEFVFCHNEVTVYQYVEEYAPELFEEIKDLVRQGRWFIIGGWYLQPDCNMPSGESFVRQIQVGKNYFKEKFGVEPRTAFNVDPFGHNIGLVQIMSKCGQDSYIFMRPFENALLLPSNRFYWKGLDGSQIKAIRVPGYNTPLGNIIKALKVRCEKQSDYDDAVVLWGVGNHGGGPSKQDLQALEQYATEIDQKIVHTYPEEAMKHVEPECVVDKSLQPSMPGCYSSMIRLKQKHIAVENSLYRSELLSAMAQMAGLLQHYPQEAYSEVVEDLLNSEFHDILPGSCIQKGEEQGLRLLYHALAILNKVDAKTYFAMALKQKKAAEGEFPFVVVNPHPYRLRTNLELEFSLADANWEQSLTEIRFEKDGKELVAQQIKEDSNLNLDWRKRYLVDVELEPFGITRIGAFENRRIPQADRRFADVFVFEDDYKTVCINPETGLLNSYVVNGKQYISRNAFLPLFFDDNADPWGMSAAQAVRLGNNPEPFENRNGDGVLSGLRNVNVIEDGPLVTVVQSVFALNNTRIVMDYWIYKNKPYIDVKVRVFMNDINKLLKLCIPVDIKGQYVGQCAYGTDKLPMDGSECVSQRFVAIHDGEDYLQISNDCIYASSYENGCIYLTLQRSPAYCAHPIDEPAYHPDIVYRPLIDENRYIPRMDQGEIQYSFRLTVCKEEELECNAMEFNRKPYGFSVFPLGEEDAENINGMVINENPNVVLQCYKKAETTCGYVARMINNCTKPQNTKLTINGETCELSFTPYEVKTLHITTQGIREVEEMII